MARLRLTLLPRSHAIRVVLGFIAILLLYSIGLLVRRNYGISIVLHNASEETVSQVSVKVEILGNRGGRYELPDLRPGDQKRIFVRPVTESHINLEFTDFNKKRHSETVYGYAESGYCGAAEVTILQENKVTSRITPACWKSWFDFI